MKSFNTVLFAVLCPAILLCGCASKKLAFDPKPEDMLTQKEKFTLIDSVRRFIERSDKISRKLKPAERDIIKRTDPKIRIHYTAPKTGRLNMVWEFFDGRSLIANCEGKLPTKYNPTAWSITLTSGSFSGAESPAKYDLKTKQ